MDFLVANPAWGLILKATLAVKGVLILLLFMSFYSWAIIFYKFFVFFRVRRDNKLLLRFVEEGTNFSSLIRSLESNKNKLGAKMLVRAIEELKRITSLTKEKSKLESIALENLDRSLLSSRSKITLQLKRSLPFLATCSNSAPFIGLFGTVWGIMHSFHAIGLQKSASLATVAPGISEALIATAIGLAVAIPATMAYNYFLTKLQDIDKDLEILGHLFLNQVKRNIVLLNKEKEGEG